MFKHIKKIVGIFILVGGILEGFVKIYEIIRDYNKPDKDDKDAKSLWNRDLN